MDFSWILLALFLVAVIRGITKSLSASMLKNLLRLGSVVVAFLISFVLQLCGAFQGIVNLVMQLVSLSSLIPELAAFEVLIAAFASTLVSPILFIIVFLLILWIIRIVIHFVVKGIEKSKANKATEAPAEENAECAEENAECVEENAECVEENAECVEENAECGTQNAECIIQNAECAEENAECENAETVEASAEPVAEEPVKEEPVAEIKEEKPKKAKKEKKAKKAKKPVIYPECAWKRIISVATGTVSGLLLLGVLMMPMFYYMSLASATTDAVENTDADDSMVYQLVEVVDDYIVEPFEDSFVNGFYDLIGISDLMNFTTRAGGKITLDNGETAYADDTLKGILSHGISAFSQLTSVKSECNTVGDDVNAIVSDPMVSSVVADVVMGLIGSIEMEEPTEDDLMSGLVVNFLDFYKDADKATIEKDLKAVGNTVGILAEEKIILQLMGGEADFTSMLTDSETLGDVVEAISGLSAFGPTIEGAFELGIEILGETLNIPANDYEAYVIFMDDLTSQMVKDNDVKFDLGTIQYYVYHTERLGVKATSTNGVKGYGQFNAYVAQWKKVQSAFAHASEDQSYGYFTIVINGNTYVYDESDNVIVIYSENNPEIYEKYKDKVSPLAGLINALALRSSQKQLTRDNLYTILEAYSASANDAVGVELANRILMKEGFVSKAVTTEKMLAATNFSDWTDEEKATDSRLCVDIITNLLGLMTALGGENSEEGVDGALGMIDQFQVLGETMDTMKQTSCVNELPPLLIEGIVKNEMFSQFMSPSIAFKINDIVDNNDKTYADCMNQIGSVLKFAISAFGGVTNG